MKKIFTFVLGLASCAAAVADTKTVSTGSELLAEFTKVRTNEMRDTIYVKWVEGGLNMKAIGASSSPKAGHIHLIGLNNEETGAQATIMFEMALAGNTEADQLDIIFENLIVKDNNGAMGNSKHLLNFKDTLYHFVDTLAFRNCEITDICRTLYRAEPQAKSDGGVDGGEVRYFEMTDCSLHYGSMQSNAMPLFYLGQKFDEMVFRNNTFYDLPYLKSIVAFAYMNEEVGRVDLSFTFENNTVSARPSQGLFKFDGYVGQMSEFHINNNFFLVPNWSDECNNIGCDADSLLNLPQKELASIQYGQVEIKNNVIEGYKPAKALLDADGEGEWLSADTANFTMADVDFSWDKFVDAPNDLFGIWNQEKVYTAGVDGTPIGNLNNYTSDVVAAVTLTVGVEGSKSATVEVAPLKSRYLSGDVVTVKVDLQGDLNEFLGWSDGSKDLVREITLTEDLALVAQCKEIPYIAVWNFRTNYAKTFDAPITPNYANLDGYELRMKTWDTITTAYVDTLSKAFQGRDNKLSTDTVINCVMLRSSLMNIDTLGKPDFAYISIPSVPQATTLSFYAGTDNYCRKNVLVDYSLDGETWTNCQVVTIAEGGKWTRANVALPTAIEGKSAYVRIMGDVTSDRLHGPDFDALYQIGEADYTYEFLCLADIRLLSSSDLSAIESIESDNAASQSVVYDLMGRKVVKPVAGQLYIMGGKKFIVK